MSDNKPDTSSVTVAKPDIHPKPEEIKPYVAIGPSKDLELNVNKSTFDTMFIVITVIFIIVSFTFVGLMLYLAGQKTQLPPPPPPLQKTPTVLTVNSNMGGVRYPGSKIYGYLDDGSDLKTQSLCTSHSNTIWANDACQCVPPFYGPTCDREKHDSKYFAAGIANESTLKTEVISSSSFNSSSLSMNFSKKLTSTNYNSADSKSFTADSCSTQCDNDDTCIGFLYHSGSCALLNNKITVPKGDSIDFSYDIDANLYLKNSVNPLSGCIYQNNNCILEFDDIIFLADMIWSFPNRYWLVKEAPGYTQVALNTIEKINFAPTVFKANGLYTGIYTSYKFTYDEIPIIIERGSVTESYIHYTNTPLSLPLDWKYKTEIYVVYIG